MWSLSVLVGGGGGGQRWVRICLERRGGSGGLCTNAKEIELQLRRVMIEVVEIISVIVNGIKPDSIVISFIPEIINLVLKTGAFYFEIDRKHCIGKRRVFNSPFQYSNRIKPTATVRERRGKSELTNNRTTETGSHHQMIA